MTTTLLEAPSSGAAEMVEAGSQQVAELQARIEALNATITTGEATLETLAQDRAEREHVLHEAQEKLQQLEAAHIQAQSYAKLAHRMPNEQEAIKATSVAKGAVTTARKELERLSKEQDAANNAQEAQEKELQESIYRAEMERQGRLLELAAVSSGLEKATAELGIERHATLMQGYRELLAHADDLHTQLIEAQVAAHDYHIAALDALKEWPEFQKEMKHQVPADDAMTRCMEAMSFYIEAMLKDLKDVREVPPELQRRGLTIWGCLTVDPQIVMQSARYPGALVQHNAVIHKILDVYREYMAAQ